MFYREIVRIDPQLLISLDGMAVADISDVLPATLGAAGLMHRSIRSMVPGRRICGQAITGFVANGDGLVPHIALYVAKPGDVLVLSNGSNESRSALGGGNASLEAKKRGIAGTICDGLVRDLSAVREQSFPTWAKGTTAAHGNKDGTGWVNKPISCGGVVVNPGDIAVADDDGVIVFPPSYVEFVITEVRKLQARDAIVQGRITGGEHIFEMAKFDEAVTIEDGHWTSRRE